MCAVLLESLQQTGAEKRAEFGGRCVISVSNARFLFNFCFNLDRSACLHREGLTQEKENRKALGLGKERAAVDSL